MSKNKNLTIEEAFNLAIQNHQNNNLQDAKSYYQKVLKIDPNHLGVLNNLGVIFQDLGEYQKAKDCYEKVIKINPSYTDAHYNLGVTFKKLGKHQQAKECYEKAIELNPNYINAFNNLGGVFQDLGDFQKAKECFEKAIKIDPLNLNANYNIGNVFKELQDYQKAKECYEKVIEINPTYAYAYNNLGSTLKILREYQKAKECYEKAIEINPNYSNAHNNLGVVFSDLKETQKAKSCYEKAIKSDPNYASAHSNLGNTLKILDENEKAIDCYKTAKRIDPNINCDVSFAAAYLKNKDPNNALILLKTYLKKYPKNPRANAYKTIALRGLERFDEIEELIDFSNLVRTINTEILTSEKIFEFNKELRSALIEDPRRRKEKNTQGWAIRGGTVIRNLFETTNHSILKFEIFLKKAIDYYISNLPDNIEHPFLMGKTKKYTIDTCWANLLTPGDFQSSHIHNNGWMSGVYYLDEPEIEPNKEHAGWIEFNRAGYNLPHFAGEKGIELIKPKAGMFIFFPSYVWHGTIPYTHKHNRISISFDIQVN